MSFGRGSDSLIWVAPLFSSSNVRFGRVPLVDGSSAVHELATDVQIVAENDARVSKAACDVTVAVPSGAVELAVYSVVCVSVARSVLV